ncbi:MAG: tetraacyldisaccharide 4'-kinase [Hyphomicrobium sp.]
MRLDEPGWWYGATRAEAIAARGLSPLGRLYGHLVQRRFKATTAYRSRLPVVCVGNLTAGGTGKTPLVAFIAQLLKAAGCHPVILSRGHGGRLAGPHWVAPGIDTAHDCGDEPLLLADVATVMVARDRRAGAMMIERSERPADVIVMDDGLQNPSLIKDLVIAVVDGLRGFGNGEIIPAGPLRAPLDFQLGLTDCIVVNGGAGPSAAPVLDRIEGLRRDFLGPVLSAHVEPAETADWLPGQDVVAYAGIGHPQRVFDMIAALGGHVVEAIAFADHHAFSDADARRLLTLAIERKAMLVTTAKDRARLIGGRGALADLAAASRVLHVRLAFSTRDRERLVALLDAAMKGGGRE